MWAFVRSDIPVLAFIAMYFGVLAYLLSRGWLFRAGLGMAFIALLPPIWDRATRTDEGFVGDGILYLALLALPLLFMLIGVLASFVRLYERLRGRRTGTGTFPQ